MKKILALLLSASIMLGLAGCKESEEGAAKIEVDEGLSGKLTIWSFTNEIKVMATVFKEKYPNVEIEYVMTSDQDGEFPAKLDAAIQSNDLPDVVALESAFVRKYVEANNLLMDISDMVTYANDIDAYQFMVDIGTVGGVTKAFPYQATPGGFFYRRSLAKEYFGTDDPDEIQKLISDFTKFEEAAKVVNEKSNGNTYMVSSVGDFTNPYYNNRTQPWVVDGKLTIDQKIMDILDIGKRFRENGYEARAESWSEGWYAGMGDKLVDADGTAKQVFGYFLPTWGLPYVLMSNGGDTSGDWGLVEGPLQYCWGGTWLGVTNNAANKEIAKEFVRFSTLDTDNLKNWALGVYTNEYLTAIDPDVGPDLAQGAGDLILSKSLVKELTPQFDDAETSKFLNGQNNYKVFGELASKVNQDLLQATDKTIQDAFNDQLYSYMEGTITKDEAISKFKASVAELLPNITVE